MEREQPLILLVDRDLALRTELERALAKAGYEIRGAAAVEEAMRRAAADLPDAVVTDLTLAHPRGGNLIQQLRDLPGGERIPVVVLGDHEHTEELEAVFAAGGPAIFLKRGADRDLLERDVATLIGRARLIAETRDIQAHAQMHAQEHEAPHVTVE